VAEARAGRAWWRRCRRSPLFLGACIALGGLILAGLLAGVVAPYSPTGVDALQVFRGPSASHLFGTDRFGRDVLSRIIYGVRVSLGIAGASILAAVAVGGALGLLAGLGRGADQLLGRVMDVFFAFPPILLAIGISAVLGAGPGTAVVAIAVVYAPFFFRVVRGGVLV
jgi:peptide/nickel transport system permease protein